MVVTKHLKYAPWLAIEPLVALFTIYQKAGYEIRPVGGCIRDALLNNPINDWDLTTNAPPEVSLDICKNAGLHVIPTGLKHGTITAIFNHIPFEITTLRIDTQSHGRHADVIWTGDWAQDAMRRDFTINSLYGDQKGDIYDYTGGLADLEHNIIRFVGNPHERVTEDYLRILRFFRFMARFGNFDKIDKPSLDACINNQEGLKQISAERIRAELLKILIAPQRTKAVCLMNEHSIFKTLGLSIENSDLSPLDKTEKKFSFETSALRTLAYILPRQADWAKTARSLKLSNKEKAHLLNIQKGINTPVTLTPKILRYFCYVLGLKVCQDIYILKYSDDAYQVDDWYKLLPSPFPLSGKDLLKLGIKADENMGALLKELEQDYIESDFTLTKAQLINKII